MVIWARAAYALMLCALVVTGYFLIDLAWWVLVLIGVAAMLPIVIADIVTIKRRAVRSVDDPSV